jgi:hypothetical protein
VVQRADQVRVITFDRIVFAVAGSMVLLSNVLGLDASPAWIWLGVFVGANLLQSAFTGFCPLVYILKALGSKERRPACRV